LGAAAGTTPESELASPANGMLAQDSGRKAYEIGKARMASLIGTAGPSSSEKTGNTVFVAAGSAIAFNDGGNGAQGSSTTYTFGPGSTSTATITIAGAGNLSRQRGGGAPYVVASNSLQVANPIATDASQGVALSEAAQPTLGYNYTPAANAAATGNAVAASFSDAITATGILAQNMRSVTPARVQTSQVQPNAGQSANGAILTSQVQPSVGQTTNGTVQTSEIQPNTGQSANGTVQTSEVQRDPSQLTADAVNYDKLIELTRKQMGLLADLQGDGTRTLVSTSVSASPSVTAALRMANVVNATRLGPIGQSVEAFQVGPSSGPKTQTVAATTVADPIKGKVMASAGPLNSSLALP
jgi:hypothetical protein